MDEKQTIQELLALVTESVRRAIDFEKVNLDAALYYYELACECLTELKNRNYERREIIEKHEEYINRISQLKELRQNKKSVGFTINSKQQSLRRVYFLYYQALDEDERNCNEEAIKLYSEAASSSLELRKEINDEELSTKLLTLIENAIYRAEKLKGVSSKNKSLKSCPTKSCSENQNVCLIGPAHYTIAELEVLKQTSIINGISYVPFLQIDLQERFAYSLPFSDSSGTLKLSSKQKLHFHHWARLEELASDPKIVVNMNPLAIKQTLVSDCSFVASMTVSALHEKRFNSQLLSSKIYPQNKKQQPVYNPCGKYMVQLYINGIVRKIIIDDYLPVNKYGELLCSFSSTQNELWPSLLEKAYLKVMGGYDFPGSNSNIDLYALTGWIPERLSIKDPDFDANNIFNMLCERFYKGHVIMTVATGALEEELAHRAGLVALHAYAILDLQEVNLKNPWSHLRWKGRFSELDDNSWTPEMQQRLKYNPRNASTFDNGVFWIDLKSLCHFFDTFYLSWNPALFKYTYVMHQCWNAGVGPARDLYNIRQNPQFLLKIKNKTTSAVWVLLTRHITELDDFKENNEYITLLVYKNNGKHIYYPYDPPPYLEGVRINSPHYLCKLITDDCCYTLVVSQYEKTRTIYFSLRIFSMVPFEFSQLSTNFSYKQEVQDGFWKGKSAGGCPNYLESYFENPCYQLDISSPPPVCRLFLELKGPKEFTVGLHLFSSKLNMHNLKADCGPYRPGFVVLESTELPSGKYYVIPSTFYPGKEGPFFLTVFCTSPFSFSKIVS